MRPLLTLCFIYALLSTLVHANAAELGRFFTAPDERNNLDTLRRNSKEEVLKEVESPAPSITKPSLVTLPDNVTMQGYVTRSDGKKATVWVNHQPMQEGSANDQLSIGKISKNPNTVPIQINASKKVLGLKAGQAYQPATDEMFDIGNQPTSNSQIKEPINNRTSP